MFELINRVRAENPLVHNITNAVAAHFAANGLLAVGASPIMADEPAEMADMAAICDALLINIGTLNQSSIEAMLLAGKAANARGLAVVLDPVGVAATALRRETVARLLSEVKFAAIRGNAAEMAFVAGESWQGKGVDAGSGSADVAAVAQAVARQYGCISAVSGATDYVSDGIKTFAVHNGTPMLPQITASGCLLGSVIAAFLAVADKAEYLNAALAACTAYAVAGEKAAAGLHHTQSGSFGVCLLDTLGALMAEEVALAARIEAV
ncbi:hydroxyethylthiazole kinase [Neisseria perflava]|uniref:hydroxyethylthiazole kinase n=1 Tax=Neisseria perflava TaxID=33053 RepID=UPI00209C8EBD|nr:hydroxyethylthiazole kinase [Neisseria perflava]MCP1660183.1 hydroxyethylthiazole kinase [Neisseria perflava]